jgi:prepilin-type N-terminal cleavage/methylation domain-containing protein
MQKGFTIIEILIVTGIVTIFAFAGFSAVTSFQRTVADLGLKDVETILLSAGNRSRSGAEGTDWGVYFPYDEETRQTDSVVIFSGSSYDTRNTDKDVVLGFNDSLRFVNVSLSGEAYSTGNDHEVVFSLYSGNTDEYGQILLESYSATTTINVSKHGFVTWE